MKVADLLAEQYIAEGLLDKVKAALGAVKGKVVGSMNQLLKDFKRSRGSLLTTIEKFKIDELNVEYLARVDTGALVCSIDASDIEVDEAAKTVKFKHAGKSFDMKLLRMKEARNANGSVNRPRVELTYEWSGKKYSKVETTLNDRSKMKFKILIGRNLISMLKLPVHVSDDESFE